MAAEAAPPRGFANFSEFYPFYLAEHANPTSRRLHVVGTTAALAQCVAAALLGNGWLVLSGVVTGYALAWLGHFVFERNRPATFRHPLYSLRGDFTMARDVFAGRITW
jgi:hypothetical protein